MKERPIIFSGPMVRAILGGKKTQTRRKVKPQPSLFASHVGDTNHGRPYMPIGGVHQDRWPCPYGQPGDRLWVRETFSEHPLFAEYFLRADGEEFEDADGGHIVPKWKSPLFMPRRLSRITLEIVNVRVERLQDISTKDILAEGAVSRSHHCDAFALVGANPKCPVSSFDGKAYPDLRSLWAAGWASINGANSYLENPWVWVIEFKRL